MEEEARLIGVPRSYAGVEFGPDDDSEIVAIGARVVAKYQTIVESPGPPEGSAPCQRCRSLQEGSAAEHELMPQSGGSGVDREPVVVAIPVVRPLGRVGNLRLTAHIVTSNSPPDKPAQSTRGHVNLEREVLVADVLLSRKKRHDETQGGVPVVEQVRGPVSDAERSFRAQINPQHACLKRMLTPGRVA